MLEDEQEAWDNAKRQAGLGEDHTTIPMQPISNLNADETVAFPEGFQPGASYGQGAQNAGNGGYPDIPLDGTVYPNAVPDAGNAYPNAGMGYANTIPNAGNAYMNAQGMVPPPAPVVRPAGKVKMSTSKKLLIASGVVIVLLMLGLGGFLLLPALAAGKQPQAVEAPTPTVVAPTPTVKPANKNIYTPFLTQYRTQIREQIASGLHLTPNQMNTQLASGKTLSSIATAQGLTNQQYQKLVTDSFQTAFQPAIDNNSLTQQQVDTLIKRMLKQPKTLDKYLTVVVHPKKTAKATPTAVNQ